MENIKRDVLCLTYYERGLSMFCLESKIFAISVLYTRRIIRNPRAKFFFFFLYFCIGINSYSED